MDSALRWKESLEHAETNYPKDEVIDFARKKKITNADLIQFGLVAKRKLKKRHCNLFRDGIIFLIHDLAGSLVGFGKKPFSDDSQRFGKPFYRGQKEVYASKAYANEKEREENPESRVRGLTAPTPLYAHDKNKKTQAGGRKLVRTTPL